MRGPILRLKNRQMRCGLSGDAVRRQKSTQLTIGKARMRCRPGADFLQIVSCGIDRRDQPGPNSFILMTSSRLDCTVVVAARLLFRPGTTLPALPVPQSPSTAHAVTESIPSAFLVLQTPDN